MYKECPPSLFMLQGNIRCAHHPANHPSSAIPRLCLLPLLTPQLNHGSLYRGAKAHFYKSSLRFPAGGKGGWNPTHIFLESGPTNLAGSGKIPGGAVLIFELELFSFHEVRRSAGSKRVLSRIYLQDKYDTSWLNLSTLHASPTRKQVGLRDSAVECRIYL